MTTPNPERMKALKQTPLKEGVVMDIKFGLPKDFIHQSPDFSGIKPAPEMHKESLDSLSGIKQALVALDKSTKESERESKKRERLMLYIAIATLVVAIATFMQPIIEKTW